MQLLNRAGTSEQSEAVSATVPEPKDELPLSWNFTAIGTKLGGARYTEAQDTSFIVSGAGTDIGGTADSEGFLYKKITGDATLTVRLVSTIARQYDQHTWVMGSYTHSWTNSSSDGAGYNTKNMLEITKQYSRAEGDFPWGVAYHPYPQDLTQPRFWENDKQSTYSLNSQYCTFKNLEVIDAWARDTENFYQGRQKRLLFLSENGTNSPDYTATQLSYQAAGACWAWKKVARLTGIDGIQWHNWQDNRVEYGLRIGLRRFYDDEEEPNGCKPVWYVWQAAETENEDEVFKPYLRILRKTNWDAIFDERLMPVEQIADEQPGTTDGATRVFTLDGRLVGYRLDILPRGIYIMRQGNRSRKVMR